MALGPLLTHPAVRRARAVARGTDGQTLRDQLELVRIPAPSLGEGLRAAEVCQRLRAAGLADARLDGVGNVLAPFPCAAGERAVMLAAHLDTVFPAETELDVVQRGERWYAPGISDNARGLAAMLAVARALTHAGVRTRCPLIFAATVGEEGAGDLRGVKHLFGAGISDTTPAAFVALDGCGLRGVVHRAVGARRFRVEVRGAGGHSWAHREHANALHAVARAVSGLSEAAASAPQPSALAATRMGGGTSVNSIPGLAWAELDMRSEHSGGLHTLERLARDAFESAVRHENERRAAGTPPLVARWSEISDRPPGETPASAPLVLAALGVTRAVGATPELLASSTDANVPMALGVPAVAVGAGGHAGGVHTTEEWFDNRGGARGIERALLLLLAIAGVAES